MSEFNLDVGTTVAIRKPVFNDLLASLQRLGYQTIGPRIEDGAIAYRGITGLEDLPHGTTSQQGPGRYRLVGTGHDRYFEVTPGAQSWKPFFFPPHSEILKLQRNNGGWKIERKDQFPPAFALIGVRPCELAAIAIQDRVFLREDWNDPIYRSRRQAAFILAVNCLHPSSACFCASMGTGPRAEHGFDLSLTELEDIFLIEVGSEAGRMAMANLPFQPASAFLLQEARKGIEEARHQMGRSLPDPKSLPDLLLHNLDHPHWDDVASRCLSCANCTQVCPTCFCWDVKDTQTLTGETTQRARVWDSCFNPDYSYIAGGNTRPNTRSRYRQWLTHKLASWYHQFGVSGCVGCGRCITWCPAGIDITAEVAALRKEEAV